MRGALRGEAVVRRLVNYAIVMEGNDVEAYAVFGQDLLDPGHGQQRKHFQVLAYVRIRSPQEKLRNESRSAPLRNKEH